MARKPKDLTGQKIGSLTIKSYAGKVGKYPSWWCECDCGKTFPVPAYVFHQKQAVGCPFCQIHVEATSILWQGQRITVIPRHCHYGRPVEYLGELVKQITNTSGGEVDAVLIMLDPVPDESLAGLGSELEDPAGGGDNADSAEEIWQNNPIHFSKSVDK